MAADQNNAIYAHIPFHLQIGVTGHRKLIVSDQLIKSIQDALTIKIKKLLEWNEKGHTQIEFSILSPIAEGADRIVAKEAKSLLQAKLHVVLPMSREEYIEDFATPESRADFEKLLKKANHHTQLIKQDLASYYPKKDPEERRRLAYEKAGHYVVDNCDILIAVWDGKPAKSKAGTGAIVDYACSKGKPMIIISSEKPTKIPPDPGNGDSINKLKQLEMFNSYRIYAGDQNLYIESLNKSFFPPLRQLTSTVEKKMLPLISYLKKLRDYLLAKPKTPGKKDIKLPNAENIDFIREQLFPWYVRASTIAKKSQKRYHFVGLLVYLLSPIAVALVALGILVHQLSWLLFSFELLILSTVYLFITMADKTKIHKKWIECRYLCEHLRCAIFLAACGFGPKYSKNVKKFRTSQLVNNWADVVFIDIIKKLPPVPAFKPSEAEICIDYIKEFWINDQIQYHKDKIHESRVKGNRLEWAGRIVFLTALAAALVHVMLILTGIEEKSSIISAITTFAAVSLPALGASLAGIRLHREYSRLEKQSKGMISLLENNLYECEEIKNTDSVKDPKVFKKFLDGTMETMLYDVGDWLNLMESIKIESV